MSLKIRLLFITIADNDFGYGHLSRCLSIAHHAAKTDLVISFLLFGDNKASLRIIDAGFSCLVKPINDLDANISESLTKFDNVLDGVIIDFSHQDLFRDILHAQQVLNKIRARFTSVVLIDALGKQALYNCINDIPVDILVVPYVGADTPARINSKILEGSKYALLSSSYTGQAKRIVRQKAKRILLSCGGSDPKNLTSLILSALNQIKRSLDVRVIIGPLFNKSAWKELSNIISNSEVLVEFIDSPQVLVEHMNWCDIAIATSGLIKYELAATGTPQILISIDNIHNEINKPFSKIGCALDLGVNVSEQLIIDKITDLLDDYNARKLMAKIGQKLIDGNGTERVINEVIKLCNRVELSL